ncbi:MAG: hypothetical protein M3O30_09720 [Planctomycetota bacterium]|nr:hypothetical protein [Planctomycetota bacterium]
MTEFAALIAHTYATIQNLYELIPQIENPAARQLIHQLQSQVAQIEAEVVHRKSQYLHPAPDPALRRDVEHAMHEVSAFYERILQQRRSKAA